MNENGSMFGVSPAYFISRFSDRFSAIDIAGSLPDLDLLSAIVPFQYLGWHLAREKGVVPEKMRYPGLSQKLKIKTRVGT